MKKILFATTALVATAGVAAAQDIGVTVSGSAEAGIFSSGGSNDQFFTDWDVDFSMEGEADNGLRFGASIDLADAASDTCTVAATDDDEDDTFGENIAVNAANGAIRDVAVSCSNDDTGNNSLAGASSIFLAFGGARLDIGDVDGALDAVIEDVALAGGSIADDETSHTGFQNDSFFDGDGDGDGQIATFQYSMNGFTGAFSIEQGNNGAGDETYGVGVRYETTAGTIDLGVGAGYQTQNDFGDIYAISVDGDFGNGFSAGVQFSSADFEGAAETETHFGIGVAYSMNAITVAANYGSFSNQGGADGVDTDGFGMIANYDFGGGLVGQFGYAANDNSDDSYSLGLAMSF